MNVIAPDHSAALSEAVREGAAKGQTFRVAGNGTRPVGRALAADHVLSTANLSGITLYEPSEMVIGAKAGTPVSVLEAALADKGQMLSFEPMDHRLLLGTQGEPTLGGLAASNASGPRRFLAGAARDSMIGLNFINGSGEELRSGGRVMKNVTGLDFVKALAGSHGTLALFTEVIMKVIPQPENVTTLVFHGLDDKAAIALLTNAVTTPFEVSGAAFNAQERRAYLRLEGFSFSLDYRAGELIKRFGEGKEVQRLGTEESQPLWASIRDVGAFAGKAGAVWRISTGPTRAPDLVAGLRQNLALEAVYDWSGGLVHLLVADEGDAGEGLVRAAVKQAGGHATLLRASEPIKAKAKVFQPEEPGLARLSAHLKTSFDPKGLFNPGLMG